MSDAPRRAEAFVPLPAEQIAAAIASPFGLGTWLGDQAHSETRPDGCVVVRWYDGRQLAGHWTVFDPPHRLVCDLRGDEDAASTASFSLTPREDETLLVLELRGPLAAREDPERLLADLADYAQTGRNARMARRPMLGIFPDFADVDAAESRGLPLGGVVEGMAAQDAGLAKGDVLTGIAERRVTSWPSVGPALDGLEAGQTVTVSFLRGDEPQSVELTLGSRPAPELPERREDLVAMLDERFEGLVGELDEALAGITAEEAAFQPGEGEWNVRQVLGHLLVAERLTHMDLSAREADVPPPSWPGGPDTFVQKVFAEDPVERLRDRLAEAFRDNALLGRRLLEAGAAPPIARHLVENIGYTEDHVREHLAQIRANLEAARAAAPATV